MPNGKYCSVTLKPVKVSVCEDDQAGVLEGEVCVDGERRRVEKDVLLQTFVGVELVLETSVEVLVVSF